MEKGLCGIKKILLIKLRYVGDTILLQPVIDNIRNYLPDVHLSVMVNRGTEEILKDCPGIDELICYDRQALKHRPSLAGRVGDNIRFLHGIRENRFDLVIDFSQSDRASLITWLSGAPLRLGCDYENPLKRLFFNRLIQADIRSMHIVDYQFKALEQLGIPISTRLLKIDVPDRIQEKIDAVIEASDLGRFDIKVAIHPGARREARMWRVERFAEIAKRLKAAYGAGIAAITGDSEEGLIEQMRGYGAPIDFRSSRLSLMEMAALLKRCDLFIGNDTAPAHLAAAVGTKTVALFGPTFPLLWRPYSDRAAALFSDPDCCGCTQVSCPYEGYPCMSAITVDEVWEKMVMMLEQR
jgi:ADP-heptose:LPS heptosyltransferase